MNWYLKFIFNSSQVRIQLTETESHFPEILSLLIYDGEMPVDPIQDLTHDHADLNRRALELAGLLQQLQRASGSPRDLLEPLIEFRELLFLHFAREEEGLFPFVSSAVPALEPMIHTMASGHDAICGGLARMIHVATIGGDIATVMGVFERFEQTYAEHARSEASLLASVALALTSEQRHELAALVAGL